MERRSASHANLLHFGVPAIDRHLPGGGLQAGALHEVAGDGLDGEHGATAALLLAGLLARRHGPVLWAVGRHDLFAPALAAAGLHQDRVVFAEAGSSVLLVMEEALRHSGLAGVVGEVGRLGLTASRRLQLAAEESGVTAFALRRFRQASDPALAEPNAAMTRWRVATMPSPPPLPHAPKVAGLGPGPDGGSTWCAAAGAHPQPGLWRPVMRRVVSLWLPTFPTDRLRRNSIARPADAPLVTRLHDGRRMVIGAADAAAAALGLYSGMALAQAQAMVPGLLVLDADTSGDAAALARLAAWCLRLSPLTAPNGDGLWIDATGCTHLQGGEAAMLATLLDRLAADGVAARAAIADTPGAAHALARHAAERVTIVPPGGAAAAIAGLPVAALRLEARAVATLRRLGLDRVADLAALPRAPLARRFGAGVLLRLDQALGRVAEPITPVVPPDMPQARLAYPEPLLTAESFVAVIGRLVRDVCAQLERTGLGARRLDLLFERVDGTVAAIRIGTARPSRDNSHLGRLLEEQVETVDPGLGVDAMHLTVPFAEPLAYVQAARLTDDAEADVAALVDRLSNRLGASRVWRAARVQSDVPERSIHRVSAVAPPSKAEWPSWPRPTRLLHPPQQVRMTSVLPDHPPVAFTWRLYHRVRRADGPERVAGEWWRRDAETGAVRDYWQVEDEAGRRFWLYRRGDGQNAATGDLQWFLHGVF